LAFGTASSESAYHGKFVLARKASTSQSWLANSGHPAAVAV
jgi:hypothetical protein